MADQTKTQKQLSVEAEIKALKAEGKQPTTVRATGASATLPPSTRRRLLGWIAPVVMSLGTALKGGTAQAATTDDFVQTAPSGRCIPTPAASANPEAPPSTGVAAEAKAAAPAAEPTTSATVAPTPELNPGRPAPAPAADGEPEPRDSAQAASRLKLT